MLEGALNKNVSIYYRHIHIYICIHIRADTKYVHYIHVYVCRYIDARVCVCIYICIHVCVFGYRARV